MIIDRQKEILDTLKAKEEEILFSKSKSYANGVDVLSNFKKNAEACGLTKFQVWLIYFHKHIDSILNAVKNSPQNPVDESEGLEGRIIDARNYLLLLLCLLHEDKDGK